MTDESKAPHRPRRRWEVTLNLSADSWDELSTALRNIAVQLQLDGERDFLSIVSGGYNSGYILQGTRDDSWTHDRYALAIQEAARRD